MSNFWASVWTGIIVVIVGSILLAGVIGICTIPPYLIGKVPLKVYVDDKVVYTGRSACVDVQTAGAITRVDVSDSFLCLLPTAYYVSNNVKIENLGE